MGLASSSKFSLTHAITVIARNIAKHTHGAISGAKARAKAEALFAQHRRISSAHDKRAYIGTGGTDERRAMPRAVWHKQPGRNGYACNSRALANERDESRAAIARAHMVKPNKKRRLTEGAKRYNLAMEKIIENAPARKAGW